MTQTHPSPEHHDHDHDHDHDHPQAHDKADHGHSHGSGLWGWITTIFHFHGHSGQQQERVADAALNTAEGIRTVWWALGALGLTTIMQIVIVFSSGSVALLSDTLHNLGDTLNSIPLLIAFYLARRAATRRYTYGFGKAEDVAGIVIVLSIAISAGVGLWQSVQKLFNPVPMTHLGWVAAAAVIGFLGNEAVALLQIRVGRKIGSAAMVADGLHARTDGLTSLAVLVAVIGTYFGYPLVDPIVGVLIGIAILFITRDAMVTMWYRLMDAIDPAIVEQAETSAASVAGVVRVEKTRVRWIGHQLHVAMQIVVDEDVPTRESYAIVEAVRHTLFHEHAHLGMVDVSTMPCGHGGAPAERVTAHDHHVAAPSH
jgi:cation diffusion facilitator family transporter